MASKTTASFARTLRIIAPVAAMLVVLCGRSPARADGSSSEWFSDVSDTVDRTLDLATFRPAHSGSGDWVETSNVWRRVHERARIARADNDPRETGPAWLTDARLWTGLTWLTSGGGSTTVGAIGGLAVGALIGLPPVLLGAAGLVAGAAFGKRLVERRLDTSGASDQLSEMDRAAGTLRGAITDIHDELSRDDGAVLAGQQRPRAVLWEQLDAADEAVGRLLDADARIKHESVVPRDEQHRLASYYTARVRAGDLASLLAQAIDGQMRGGRGDSWLRSAIYGSGLQRRYDNLVDLLSRVPREQLSLQSVPDALRPTVEQTLGDPPYRGRRPRRVDTVFHVGLENGELPGVVHDGVYRPGEQGHAGFQPVYRPEEQSHTAHEIGEPLPGASAQQAGERPRRSLGDHLRAIRDQVTARIRIPSFGGIRESLRGLRERLFERAGSGERRD